MDLTKNDGDSKRQKERRKSWDEIFVKKTCGSELVGDLPHPSLERCSLAYSRTNDHRL